MGTYSRTYSLTDGTVAYGSQVAFELDALGSSVNNIVNAQISAGANIADTKLAQITTGQKVHLSALVGSSQAQGDIIYASSATALALLAAGTSGQFLKTLGAGANPLWAWGGVVQLVNADKTTIVTVNSAIPLDNTIPQNTEGVEIVTVAITPKSATNVLVIEASGDVGGSANAVFALFQDTTADALKAVACTNGGGSNGQVGYVSHRMIAGTTSEITFKLRVGSSSGSMYFNGVAAGTQLFGGVAGGFIRVTEYGA